ncbi:DUF934 domain-containing protein [Aromatoleum evansii]|uniref:DUF934 domain-containing protein n=1 Tax=Aromatoleum evansii TaxID=59406 RepID=A0ABZ1ANM1_AROEV|nr:DUF934 domain-containing protein [Aromatoleum evansii]NMG31401.1 DUF934 domain-containing protein [Aromatoleum evansii]WRL46091.1 DUF934 domain-containing protein [Aromatoleum evansii]
MSKVIQNGRIVTSDWQILTVAEGEEAEALSVPAGRVIVPLATWLARREELAARADVGVWFASSEGPEALEADIARLPVIAVNFPKFVDGRGYSTAVLLRTRYGYTGQLIAFGEVLRDQFNYLARCGFDTLQPREDRYTDAQLDAAIASIGDYSEPYQASVLHPQPMFRRIARAGAKA